MEGLGRVVGEGAMMLDDLPPHQLDWHASPTCVVYFGYCIGFAKQLRYDRTRGG